MHYVTPYFYSSPQKHKIAEEEAANRMIAELTQDEMLREVLAITWFFVATYRTPEEANEMLDSVQQYSALHLIRMFNECNANPLDFYRALATLDHP